MNRTDTTLNLESLTFKDVVLIPRERLDDVIKTPFDFKETDNIPLFSDKERAKLPPSEAWTSEPETFDVDMFLIYDPVNVNYYKVYATSSMVPAMESFPGAYYVRDFFTQELIAYNSRYIFYKYSARLVAREFQVKVLKFGKPKTVKRIFIAEIPRDKELKFA